MKRLVYFARSDGMIKIGETGSWWGRLREMQTGNPHRIELIGSWWTPDAKALETELHERFAAFRRDGEWFVLPQDELEKVQRELDSMYRIGPDWKGPGPFKHVGPNLYRHQSGTYYGWFKNGKTRFKRSLKTADRKLARVRLAVLLADPNIGLVDKIRASAQASSIPHDSELIDWKYQQEMMAKVSFKPKPHAQAAVAVRGLQTERLHVTHAAECNPNTENTE